MLVDAGETCCIFLCEGASVLWTGCQFFHAVVVVVDDHYRLSGRLFLMLTLERQDRTARETTKRNSAIQTNTIPLLEAILAQKNRQPLSPLHND